MSSSQPMSICGRTTLIFFVSADRRALTATSTPCSSSFAVTYDPKPERTSQPSNRRMYILSLVLGRRRLRALIPAEDRRTRLHRPGLLTGASVDATFDG